MYFLKRLLLLFFGCFALSLLLILLVDFTPAAANGGPHGSYTATTAECASCHRTHTAGASGLLLGAPSAFCSTCHGAGGLGADTNVEDGVYLERDAVTESPVEGVAGQGLKGGGFSSALMDSNRDGLSSSMSVLASHDGTTPVVWGNGAIGSGAGITSMSLECSTCHNPHGNSNYRILRFIPTDSDSLTPVSVPDEASKNYTVSSPSNDYSAESYANATALTQWCSQCHTRYQAASGSGHIDSGDPIYAYRHSTEGTDCIDCHVAHGSSADMTDVAGTPVLFPDGSMVAFDGERSSLLRLDERLLCLDCHVATPEPIYPNPPHGQYYDNPNQCATCHRTHTAQSEQLLTSALASNDFCYSCHDGSGAPLNAVVSTHGNQGAITRYEGSFSLRCTQCHNPHGSDNLVNVQEDVVVVPGYPPLTNGPVTFTSTNGMNSFDDGSSPLSNRLCTACHSDSNNPGYPMSNHLGGDNHLGGYDFTSQNCTDCHPHSLDSDLLSVDGFMPMRGCINCHTVPQDNGDGLPAGGRRAITPEFGLTSHHVNGTVSDDDCLACHDNTDHSSGTMTLRDVDTGGLITLSADPRTDQGEALKLESFCLACHDADAAGGSAPFSDGVTPPVINQTLWDNGAHSSSGTATCFDCHDGGHGSNKLNLLAPYNAVSDGNPDDPLRQEERFCYQCHDGSVAATNVQTDFGRTSHHNVALTDQVDGSKIECTNCHNPHLASATRSLINPDTGAQWTGTMTPFCQACHDGAPPASITFSGGGSGNPVSTHANNDFSARVETVFTLECTQCHTQHGVNNLALIRQQVVVVSSPPTLAGPVTFTSLTGTNSFDDGVSPLTSRICVACHQNTSNPGYPMTAHDGGANHAGGTDYSGIDCRVCHPHDIDNLSSTNDGFMVNATACTGCHQVPQGSRRQIVGTGVDFSLTSHHVQGTVTDDDCQVCHETSQHMGGTVRLYNVDSGSVIPYSAPADLQTFCLACHDADGANGNTAPFSDAVAAPNMQTGWSASTHAQTQTCYGCHDNGHGSNKLNLLSPWNAASDGDPNDPMRQEERFCYLCHDGVLASDMQTIFNSTSRHNVALTDQQATASKVECNNCHNPHLDNATYPNANPDNPLQQWTGTRSNFCLACHDGGAPATVTLPGTFIGTGFNKSTYAASTHGVQLGAQGCNHCHDSHGSSNLALLSGAYSISHFTTYAAASYQVCWTCHDTTSLLSTTLSTRFITYHSSHLITAEAPCVECHDAHAPKDTGEPGLINFDVALNDGYDAYDLTLLANRTSSTAFYIEGNNGYCFVRCHNQGHGLQFSAYDRTAAPSPVNCTACHP